MSGDCAVCSERAARKHEKAYENYINALRKAVRAKNPYQAAAIVTGALATYYVSIALIEYAYQKCMENCGPPPPRKPYCDSWMPHYLGNCNPSSPLVLDLDSDGIEVDGIAYFDHEGNGWAEASRWSSEDDGVLVWDRNGDGKINDGTELFGNNFVLTNGNEAENGFAALAELDENGDGVVDAVDAHWDDLQILRWRDSNGNGMVDDGEKYLVSLQSQNIDSLRLAYRDSDFVDTSGNEHRQVGSYTRTDGTTAEMTDVWLVTSPSVAKYDTSSIPEHSEAIKALPEIKGFGRLYDLRDAMALDDSGRLSAPFYGNARTETRNLSALVTAFKDETDAAVREDLAEKILHRWAGAEGATAEDYFSGGRFAYTTPQRFAVVETFRGEQLWEGRSYRHPAYSTAQKIDRLYKEHYEYLHGSLMLQTHLSDLAGAISVTVVAESEEEETATETGTSVAVGDSSETTPEGILSGYRMDFAPVATLLEAESNARRSAFLRALAGVYEDSGWMRNQMALSASDWLYEYDYYAEHLEAGVYGGEARRRHYFTGMDPASDGSGGIDVFETADGQADFLRGRGGDDVYHLGYGTGHDRIQESRRSVAAGDVDDVIRVAPGIDPGRVVLSRTRDDLVLSLKDADGEVTDSLRVERHYAEEKARIERVTFEDGTEWTLSDFEAVPLSSGQGGAGSDTYDGSLDGADGTLQGGRGADTYWFGSGSGDDTVDETVYGGRTDDSPDTVRIREGIASSSVTLGRSGYDLVISLVGDSGTVTDTLTIRSHYLSGRGGIERIVFADSTEWGSAEFDAVPFTSGRGSDGDDVFDGPLDGTDAVMQGGWGGDTYWFGVGSGDDTIDEAAYAYNKGAGDGGTDAVRLKAGIAAADLRLTRTKYDLIVSLLDGSGATTDTLTVKDHYVSGRARIERVELADGTLVWDASDFSAVNWTAPVHAASAGEIAGTSGDDHLYGVGTTNDVFDADAGGNDRLHGYGGDDVYWLGTGTGADEIHEHSSNAGGDAGDVIRVKSGIAAASVRLRRSDDGDHLFVQLLDDAGVVSDSLKVEHYYTKDNAKVESVVFADGTVWDENDFMAAEIVGTSGNDDLHGEGDLNDVFDADAGGNDRLHGYGGDDVYWLGTGTGADEIREHYSNAGGDAGDVIRIKAGIDPSSVRLRRSDNGDHLFVQLLDAAGAVSDSLKVEHYYTKDNAKVESVVFADGTVWDENDFMAAEIVGTSGADHLYGEGDLNDVFDADAGGNDRLHGYGGDDIYWLGTGTGADEIREHYSNAGGDAGDVIRIKAGIDPSSVRLRRSDNGDHLFVQLLDAAGAVSDSLKVEHYYTKDNARVESVVFADGTVWDENDFMAAEIVGTSGADHLYGEGDLNDVFDADAGGNDRLHGYGGDDVYWLGTGTGADEIREHYSNAGGDAGDVIRIKAGIDPASVRLRRSDNGDHLFVQLLDAAGAVSDSLKVEHYYTKDNAKVESVVFADGTVWGANDFMAAEIVGTSGVDDLHGEGDLNDVFDADAGGNDRLHGYGGDDVYWLGTGTGNDIVREHYSNTDGDAGDVIRIKAGIDPSSVRLRRSDNGDHLFVQLLDAAGAVSDSLKVEHYYTKDNAKVESVVFADGTVWGANDFMAAEIVGTSGVDHLYGEGDLNDVFDADAGGNDRLHGSGGDDIYWLGTGTGADEIREHYSNAGGDAGDVIRIKAGIDPASVRLRRSDNGDHLFVQLLDAAGAVSDSLKVEHYYTKDNAKVESVVFADGTVWDANDFMAAEIVGTSDGDDLHGEGDLNDVFDADAGGNDRLHGYGGDDVYWLGTGTGADEIREHYSNAGGDAGDVIRIKAGIDPSSVRLRRSDNGDHLFVQLLDAAGAVSDSLKVEHYYTKDNAKVESVVFADGTVWGANDFMAAEIVGTSGADYLHGEGDLNDVFDADAGGNDHLHGSGGDDVYWLGTGTGADEIREHYSNAGGDAGDVIRIKAGIDPSSVRLRRSDDGDHLFVQLLDVAGAVSDSLKVEHYYTKDNAKVESVVFADGTVWGANDFMAAEIVGTSGADYLHGEGDLNDVFDADVGGNDRLYGYGGDDVYWLGTGTGNDIVREHYSNTDGDAGDVIRIKAGIDPSSVRLRRSDDGNHLHVQLLDADNAVADSLKVENHYTDATAKVESVVFDDGTVWDAADFAAARIVGTSRNDSLHGESGLDDVFDGDAGGNDRLYGYSGDDVYWLGAGTGNDEIHEHYSNTDGDGGDAIRAKDGIGTSAIRLEQEGNHLLVKLAGQDGTVADSLKVVNHFSDDTAKVERIEAAGQVLLARDYSSLINEIAAFNSGDSSFADMNTLLGNYWQDESTLTAPAPS